jgi:hypothetical protein
MKIKGLIQFLFSKDKFVHFEKGIPKAETATQMQNKGQQQNEQNVFQSAQLLSYI